MLAAYCWPQSVSPGEQLELFFNSDRHDVLLRVTRQGAEDVVVRERRLSGATQSLTGAESRDGCDWQPCLAITPDKGWRSGFYLVSLEDQSGAIAHAFFVLKSSAPADAILVLSTSTWRAYNDWGGPSFYTGAHVVAGRRPLPAGFLSKSDPQNQRVARYIDWGIEERRALVRLGYSDWCMAAGWSNWELLFVRWAEREGFELSYAASEDLDRDPGILNGHSLYLSVGHDEYWSAGMRDAVEDYLDAGGNAAFFSGNTSFWQVRFSDEYERMIGFKFDIEQDPHYDESGAPTLSTMWSDPLVGRPENQMTGVSFTRGGYAHMPNAPRGTGGYKVEEPDHWAFAGLNLSRGDTLGAAGLVVGYECDGCEFVEREGRLVPTGRDGTPTSFTILGTAPARLWETHQVAEGLDDSYVGELNWVAERIGGEDNDANRRRFADAHAVMGTYSRRERENGSSGAGEVFTTGCTDWAYGLRHAEIATVTRNVIRRFTGG
ncbi:MAG: N,N-dimethylformamidase beta subunit family domain-containing protein [Pseudomonadota bacterium]